MAAKGTVAKQNVLNKIKECFGEDYLGEQNNKIYVKASDGGAEKIQIAISLTCPKLEFQSAGVSGAPGAAANGPEFASLPPWETGSATPSAPVEITKEEEENIAQLMERLGL